MGITFLPIIFTWFTLRKGYTVKQRVLAIGWFVIVTLCIRAGGLAKQTETDSSAPAETTRPAVQAVAQPAVQPARAGASADREDPPKVERPITARPPEVDQLAALYRQLIRFKGEPMFKKVGFGLCCKYHDWMEQVERLRDRPSGDSWRQLGVRPSDLLMLGLEYLHSKGTETADTREMIAEFEAALFPRPAKKGFTGKMSDTDRACKSLALYQRQMDLIEAQDYARASEVIDTCPLVQKGTPMRGPLDTKTQGEVTYILVEAQGVGKVWVMEDWVDFPARQ